MSHDTAAIRPQFKLSLSVSREERRRRFREFQTDPLKQRKLSPIDRASLEK